MIIGLQPYLVFNGNGQEAPKRIPDWLSSNRSHYGK